MPNMSYCRFRNTLSDLNDVYRFMASSDEEEIENMLPQEKKAMMDLIKKCTLISELFDEDSDNDTETMVLGEDVLKMENNNV